MTDTVTDETVVEYQHYGIRADGSMAFAGVSEITDPEKILTDWLDWATEYVKTHPGKYPLKTVVRLFKENPVTKVIVCSESITTRRKKYVPDYCI